MEKEYIVSSSRSITLNITGGKIDSYRQKEETTGTVRVYQDGKIGVAGCLGMPDEEKLTAKAVKALGLGIPYVSVLDDAMERQEDNRTDILPEKEIIPTMQAMLDRVGEACPKFAISHKIKLSSFEKEYRNSKGRHLKCADNLLSGGLVFQSRGTGNLMDCVYSFEGRHFDPDRIVAQCKTMHDAFFTPAEIAEGEWPVLFTPYDLFGSFLSHFTGEMYASGVSLVSGKIGEQIFSPKLSFGSDQGSPGCCFFDEEGQIFPENKSLLVRNGVLEKVLTTKNTASQFGLPVSGTSAADYDGVPGIGLEGLYVEPTAESIREVAPEKAVLVLMASGGDTTPSGHFATPVQLAFLLENGKLVGRLPELNISGDFDAILGEDYLGTVYDDLFDDGKSGKFCIVKMQVTK